MSKIVGANGAEQIPWAPKAEDYVEGDPICPFTSSIWGALFPAEQSLPNGRTIMAPIQAVGTVYQRCQAKCMFFSHAPKVEGEIEIARARGTCCLKQAAVAFVTQSKQKEQVEA